MGGSNHNTNTSIIKNDHQTVNEHDRNEYNTNTNFDINKTTNTTVNGNSADGRSVVMDGTGNIGL